MIRIMSSIGSKKLSKAIKLTINEDRTQSLSQLAKANSPNRKVMNIRANGARKPVFGTQVCLSLLSLKLSPNLSHAF